MIKQEHFFVMGAINPTGVYNISFLNHCSGLVEKVNIDAGRLVSNQALSDCIFFCPHGLLLRQNDKEKLNILLFFYNLHDFVRGRRVSAKQCVCFLERRRLQRVRVVGILLW